MQKIKMFISVAVVSIGVNSAFAFKPVGAGTIYCFANADIPNVQIFTGCSNVAQPIRIRIDYRTSVNPADPTTNPCPNPFTQTPFDGWNPNLCIQTTPGIDHYTITAL